MLYLIGKLKDRGIARVQAKFDGQGDDGEVHDIIFYDIDDDHINYTSCKNLEDFIYDKIDELVSDYGGDWVNNDGGYGDLEIDVQNRILTGHYNQRTIDEHDWSCNLFN
tara:strand:+ start:1065 stop:1391 length:327 start_codon:yes stop_codon:yes gene_type:complete